MSMTVQAGLSDLVRNPEDQFSRVATQVYSYLFTIPSLNENLDYHNNQLKPTFLSPEMGKILYPSP